MTLHDLEYLGTALAVLRRRTGKMQKEISIETGMSRSQVSRYEHGRDTPNLVTLVKYLSTIGCDFRDLHDAILELKIQAGDSEPDTTTGIAALERSLAPRLLPAPELREVLRELLEPVFREIDQIKKTMAKLEGATSAEELPGAHD